MHSLELSIVRNFAPKIHLFEHVQRRFFCQTACSCCRAAFGFEGVCQVPSGLTTFEAVGLTVLRFELVIEKVRNGIEGIRT